VIFLPFTLIVIAAAAALIAGGLRGPMAAVVRTEGGVEVQFLGPVKVMALRSRVTLDAAAIAGATIVEDPMGTAPRAWRMAGSAVPKTLLVGLFRIQGGARELWAFRRRDPAVRITLTGAKWRAVVVQVADPDAVVALVEDVAAAGTEARRTAPDDPSLDAINEHFRDR
jgi:hypothetical protein